MRKGQNRKVNNVGSVGCLGLLALGLALVNPVSSAGLAFAEETPEDGEVSVPVAQTEVPSTVEIGFSPAAGSASISPTTSVGSSAQIKVLATVNVQKSGGYSVYVKSNSQNLVGVNSSANVIPGMQGGATYDNIPVNSWGYYATEGNVIPDGAVYKAISTTGNGDKVAENTSNKITADTKTIALSFAAKVNDEKPADTYQNTVTMSVVSSPWAIAEDFGIGNMQEMTSAICESAKDNDGDGEISGQLKDTRDGKYYWVSKLADGKCWMTQNLDLILSTKVALTPGSSDVMTSWTPGFDTATAATAETVNVSSSVETRSWSLGNVRIINPNTAYSCGSKKNSAEDCPEQFVAYATPTSANGDELAHYILGNHYQWNTATAGTGGTITSGQAGSSICPKGWKLPETNATAAGTFIGLTNAYSIGSDVAKLTSSPLYFVRGGDVVQDTNYLFSSAGSGGNYWSSTPTSSTSTAFNFTFSSTGISTGNRGRGDGFSVRCIAR